MKLVIIFGPHAVGKMTVGQELAKLTGLKLFHNHMTIELAANFFDIGTPEGGKLVRLFRQEIFEAVAASDLEGLIFTFMWAFDQPSDWEYIERLCALFRERGAEIYFVELEADFDVRIERNKTPNRLLNKPSKRDIGHSEQVFRALEARHRLNSREGEISCRHYLRLDNTVIPPQQAAAMIRERFGL